MSRNLALIVCLMLAFGSLPAAAAEPDVQISKAEQGQGAWKSHRVRSPFQEGETKINVLLPKMLDRARSYRVIYLLPVEAGDDARWGSVMAEATRLELSNKHDVICVYPTFSHLPWYADHPTDPHIQQETYFLQVVVPFIEREYAALAKREGRLLIGFSKSGWGAWSLLLRHPELFAAAAAWDAPLTVTEAKKYGMGPIFGSHQNFESYRITELLKLRKRELGGEPRLVLTGYDNFRAHHQQTHKLLDEQRIAHIYRDGPQRRHHWESGWLEEAAELLLSTSPGTEPGQE